MARAPQRKLDFLLPVHALSKVFRGKFMAALRAAHESGVIAKDPQGANAEWAKRHKALYRHDWVIFAKTPMGGPAQVLEYLARYTHRTAIGNERIANPQALESAKEFMQRVAKLDSAQCPCCAPGWQKIPELALKYRLPSMFNNAVWVDNGALLSYGPNFSEFFRRAAEVVGKVLKGAKPAEIPIEQSSTFEFVINLRTAKTLGTATRRARPSLRRKPRL